MTQRDAQYKTPAQEVYVGTGLVSEGTELVRESFFLNIDPPVPQIKQIDGYSPEEEESGSSDGGGESGGDTTPDDEIDEEFYISCHVHILPWVLRTQSVKF
jgi:hypothetical protein